MCEGWPGDDHWSCADHGAHQSGGNTWPVSLEKWLGTAADREAARARLLAVLPHIRIAVEMAALHGGPAGSVGLCVIVTQPDGSGRVTAQFQGREFFDDLTTVLGGGETP